MNPTSIQSQVIEEDPNEEVMERNEVERNNVRERIRVKRSGATS